MCWQGFVHFACGHKKIYETDCPISHEADNPFWQKVACPEYSMRSERPDYDCGAGRFYCAKTKDGPFLDHAHNTRDRAQAMLNAVDARLAPVKAAAQQFATAATERGISSEHWSRMQAYNQINDTHTELMRQRTGLQKTYHEALRIVQEGQAYHDFKRQNIMLGSTVPPFVPSTDLLYRLPAELKEHPYGRNIEGPDPTLIPFGPYPSRHTQSFAPQQQLQIPLSPVDSNAVVAPQECYTATISPQTQPMIAGHQRTRAEVQSAQMQPPSIMHRKPGRPRVHMAGSDVEIQLPKLKGRRPLAARRDSIDEDVDTVRRSARVRGKKVNYAESGGSEGASREGSPDKSEASGFSPAKSNVSASPASERVSSRQESTERGSRANELQRPAFSLTEKLSDFQRRSLPQQNILPPRRSIPGMKDLLNSSPGQEVPQFDMTMSPLPRMTAAHSGAQANALQELNHRMIEPTEYSTIAMQPQQVPSYNPAYAPNIALQKAINRQPELNRASNFMPQMPSTLPSLSAAHNNNSPGLREWLARNQNVQQPIQPVRAHMPSFLQPEQTGLQQPRSTSTPQTMQSVYEHTALRRGFETPVPVTPMAMPTSTSGTDRVRKDSIMSPNDHMDAGLSPLSAHYARMRRSFSSATALTPSSLPPQNAANTDPKKRSLPTSSPMSQPRKRVRLSFPGDDSPQVDIQDTNLLLDLNAGQPSPIKTPLQHLPYDNSACNSQPISNDVELNATPAPYLPPVATMYTHPVHEITFGYTTETQEPMTEQFHESGDMNGSYVGLDTGVIDWDLVNGGEFLDG